MASTPETSQKDVTSIKSGCPRLGWKCIYRLFYFFYIGAQGVKLIMFPLYLKQLRLPPKYAGLIAGVAPFGSGAGAPLLGYFADITNTRKAMFLFSLTILTVTPLVCLLPQPKYICTDDFVENSTTRFQEVGNFQEKHPFTLKNGRDIRNNEGETEGQEIEDLFIMLLILLLAGEILSAPAQNLADATTVCALGDSHEDYGKIRMFGSVGTVVATLPILVVARYNQFPVCGILRDDFEVTLYVLAGFAALALFIGFWLPVDLPGQMADQKNRFEDQEDKQSKREKNQKNRIGKERSECADKTDHRLELAEDDESEEGGQQLISIKEIIFTFRSITFLMTVFYLGVAMGVFYTFMFWYLDDIAPKQIPYVVGTAIFLRNIGLMSAFRISGAALRRFGSVNVINLAMAIMIPAFVIYGYLENAWIAIIPEILQNVAYGFGWTGAVAFYSESYPTNMAATTQGIVEGIYKGFGFGTGPIIAGFLLSSIGGGPTFLLFGGVTGVMLMFAIITQLISNALARNPTKYRPLPISDEEQGR